MQNLAALWGDVDRLSQEPYVKEVRVHWCDEHWSPVSRVTCRLECAWFVATISVPIPDLYGFAASPVFIHGAEPLRVSNEQRALPFCRPFVELDRQKHRMFYPFYRQGLPGDDARYFACRMPPLLSKERGLTGLHHLVSTFIEDVPHLQRQWKARLSSLVRELRPTASERAYIQAAYAAFGLHRLPLARRIISDGLKAYPSSYELKEGYVPQIIR
ncbi:MAG: hypothetical protein AAFV29_05465 [Myxococcota bacterium]